MSLIRNEDKAEYIGQIIDIFEDFLDEKGIWLENAERDAEDDDSNANIFGDDYGALSDRLQEMMKNWEVF